jgi:hypothetical protein
MSDEYDPTKDPEFADPHRRTPRAYTTEEVRELFLEAVGALINYWKNNRDDPINDPVTGVAHSILTLIDGRYADLPAFKLIPDPHPQDQSYHEKQGENWFPSGAVFESDECDIATDLGRGLFFKSDGSFRFPKSSSRSDRWEMDSQDLAAMATLSRAIKEEGRVVTLFTDEKEVFIAEVEDPLGEDPRKVIRGRGPTLHAAVLDALDDASEDDGKVFVCGSINEQGERATFCPDCIPKSVADNLGEDFVDTWRTYEGGWTSPPICQVCKLAIPVIIDGNTSEECT